MSYSNIPNPGPSFVAWALMVCLIILGLGCGSDDDPASPAGGTNIGPDGGSLTLADGLVELVFPAGALDESIEVTVTSTSSVPNDPGMILARAYDFAPDGVQFEDPVALTIHYTDSQVPAHIDEADLKLCKVLNGSWGVVPGSTVNAEENTVTGSVMSFSSYGPGLPGAGTEGQITITPAEITLPVYGAWTFDLMVDGLEDEAVTWSITEGIIGGRVRGHGVYNAPGGGGVFHIRATSQTNPAIFGEAEVTVSTNWECPEEPPEPTYELVWARTIPDIFTRWIYGIAWHEGILWVGGQSHLEHWTDQGVHLGWVGRGVDGPWPFEETYTGYHAGASETDVPAPGNEEGQFTDIQGVACDATGNVYACGFGDDRVHKMSINGAYLSEWEFNQPHTIAVSPDQYIYVAPHRPWNDSLMRFNQNGDLVDTITNLEEGLDLYQFSLLGIDDVGEIFLFFPHDEVILSRLSSSHEYLGSALREGEEICESLSAVTVDSEGNVYTADIYGTGLFKKFDRNGWLLATWPMSGPGYEETPRGIGGMTVDSYGNVYVTDNINGMILKFQQIED